LSTHAHGRNTCTGSVLGPRVHARACACAWLLISRRSAECQGCRAIASGTEGIASLRRTAAPAPSRWGRARLVRAAGLRSSPRAPPGAVPRAVGSRGLPCRCRAAAHAPVPGRRGHAPTSSAPGAAAPALPGGRAPVPGGLACAAGGLPARAGRGAALALRRAAGVGVRTGAAMAGRPRPRAARLGPHRRARTGAGVGAGAAMAGRPRPRAAAGLHPQPRPPWCSPHTHAGEPLPRRRGRGPPHLCPRAATAWDEDAMVRVS
jgi:hypothetical protein